MTVGVRRVRDEASADDGTRVLVDRLWPRGLAKAAAQYDEWSKDAAPSPELRRWFGHDPERFDEFAERYRAELASSPAAEAVEHLRALAAKGRLTLLTATRDLDVTHARVLAAVLDES